MLRGMLYNGTKKEAHRPEKLDQNDPVNPISTAETVAAEIGVSGKTYDSLRTVSTEGTEEFDRKHILQMQILTRPKLELIRHHAESFGVTERTVYRWISAGVNLSDAAEVALHVGGLKHPAPAALDATEALLKHELETL
jgi:hypothetical protein